MRSGTRSTSRGLLGLVAAASMLPGAASAEDENGRYAIRGAGLLTCEDFTAARAASSDAYAMIGGWVDGYITAVNRLSKETFDVAPYASTELMMILIDRHCADNVSDNLFAVVHTLAATLFADRLETSSPQADVRVDTRQVRLYEATIARIQTSLGQHGYLEAEPTGRWSDATRTALEAYQAAVGLQATGFPDQATLWRLLRSP